MQTESETIALLDRWNRGEREAGDDLIRRFYAELRRLAGAQLEREWGARSLQATELVHEAWFRLCGHAQPSFENRRHFFGSAARAMREVVIDRARRRQAEKRGQGQAALSLEEILDLPGESVPLDVLALDGALARLETLDAEQARIVELRYFLGLSIEQTAEALGLHPSAVNRRWESARAWLLRQLRA